MESNNDKKISYYVDDHNSINNDNAFKSQKSCFVVYSYNYSLLSLIMVFEVYSVHLMYHLICA